MIDIITTSLMLLVLILITGIFGEYLWNNVARKLFKGLGEATWVDIILISILFSIVLPG